MQSRLLSSLEAQEALEPEARDPRSQQLRARNLSSLATELQAAAAAQQLSCRRRCLVARQPALAPAVAVAVAAVVAAVAAVASFKSLRSWVCLARHRPVRSFRTCHSHHPAAQVLQRARRIRLASNVWPMSTAVGALAPTIVTLALPLAPLTTPAPVRTGSGLVVPLAAAAQLAKPVLLN